MVREQKPTKQIHPNQPFRVPPNCVFLVDDIESAWLPDSEGEYDLIHGRNMVGSIGNWENLFASIYTGLKPHTGWLEMQEFDVVITPAHCSGSQIIHALSILNRTLHLFSSTNLLISNSKTVVPIRERVPPRQLLHRAMARLP